MVKDAEDNAEADKERRELIEARGAESLIHSTEKSIEDHGDKVDPSTIEAIELAIAALKDDLEGDKANAEKIKSSRTSPRRLCVLAKRSIRLRPKTATLTSRPPLTVPLQGPTTTSSMPSSRIWTTTSAKAAPWPKMGRSDPGPASFVEAEGYSDVKRDYYEVLGVSEGQAPTKSRKAFRKPRNTRTATRTIQMQKHSSKKPMKPMTF